LTVAGKEITRRATVAWCKRILLRKNVTQGNYGPRSTLTATGIMITRHAGVAWLREKFVRKDRTRNQAEQETAKGRKDGEGLWKGPECNSGIRDRGLRQQLRGRIRISDQCGGQPLYLRKERTTTNGIEWWSSGQQSHVESGVTLKKILYALFRGKVEKQVVGTTRGLRRIKKWTLWREVGPLRNGKRDRARSKSRICGSTGHSRSYSPQF
jgi:hypothetical protein